MIQSSRDSNLLKVNFQAPNNKLLFLIINTIGKLT